MKTSILRSLIRETLLTEEVYGAQAVVYHGTKADPQVLISALLDDEFVPGRGKGAMYGKGLYTVYDFAGTQTSSGEYGDHVIKLKLNLYGYIIFDPDVAMNVYKAPLSIVAQAQEIGLDEEIIEKLRGVDLNRSEFSSNAALFASGFLAGKVKGIVYTGTRDGRCALVYDPTTAVPIAWKNIHDMSWTPVDKERIKPALRRSASGDWEKDKYDLNPFVLLKRLEQLPVHKRIVRGNLDLFSSPPVQLPDGLKVEGDLQLSRSKIQSLPNGLVVGGSLRLSYSSVTSLPSGLQVGRDLSFQPGDIARLPPDMQVGRYIFGFVGDKLSVPQHLRRKLR